MTILLILLSIHFVADFVLQSHWMATNKSTSNRALSAHVGVYGLTFLIALIAMPWLVSVAAILIFVIVTMLLHFATDWVTSRMTSALWKRQEVHWFFVVVGIDQLIHAYCLALTAVWCGFASL